MNKISVQGQEISIIQQNGEDFICLTDMTKGFEAGSELIERWLRNQETVNFLAIWEKLNNTDFNSVEFDGIKMKELGTNQKEEITKKIGSILKSGTTEDIDTLIAENGNVSDLKQAMFRALSHRGKINMVKHMVNNHNITPNQEDFNHAFTNNLIHGNHKEIIKYFKDDCNLSADVSTLNAAIDLKMKNKEGHITKVDDEILKELIDPKGEYKINPNRDTLNAAIRTKRYELVSDWIDSYNDLEPDLANLNDVIKDKKYRLAKKFIETCKVEPDDESRRLFRAQTKNKKKLSRKERNLRKVLGFKRFEIILQDYPRKITALGILLFLLGIGGVVFKVRAKKKKDRAEKSKPTAKKTEVSSSNQKKSGRTTPA